jgi:hypothetical protein
MEQGVGDRHEAKGAIWEVGYSGCLSSASEFSGIAEQKGQEPPVVWQPPWFLSQAEVALTAHNGGQASLTWCLILAQNGKTRQLGFPREFLGEWVSETAKDPEEFNPSGGKLLKCQMS